MFDFLGKKIKKNIQGKPGQFKVFMWCCGSLVFFKQITSSTLGGPFAGELGSFFVALVVVVVPQHRLRGGKQPSF